MIRCTHLTMKNIFQTRRKSILFREGGVFNGTFISDLCSAQGRQPAMAWEWGVLLFWLTGNSVFM